MGQPPAARPTSREAARKLAQLLQEVASLDDAAAIIEAYGRAQAIEAIGRYQEQ